MALFTPKLNLRKPDRTEFFSIVRDFNDNWDKLDAKATTVDEAIALKADKATTYTKTEIDTEFGEVTAQLADKADKLKATNLVTNGDFSQGTTGWNGLHGSIASVGDTLRVTGTGANAAPRAGQRIGVSTQNHKIYVRAQVKPKNAANSLILSIKRDSEGGTTLYEMTATPVVDVASDISFIALTNDTSPLYLTAIAIYADAATATGKVHEIRIPIAIDLTAAFGVGNEPTKEQMDRLLAEFPNSWFNGTAEILPLKTINEILGEKANRTQEAWITPTLLNGWTEVLGYPVRYRKNHFGKVEFKGRVQGGVAGTQLFGMPFGYRALTSVEKPLAHGSANTFVRAQFNLSNNSIYITTAYTTYVDLNGLEYFTD